MMKDVLLKYLNSHDFHDKSKDLILKYFLLLVGSNALVLLSSAFYVIYIISLIGIVQLGILMSIRFIVQALVDYPTGFFGDLFGQRWVLFGAYILHSVSMLLLMFSKSVQTNSPDLLFAYFILVFVLEALALSQESGALQAWFDNNYKEVVYEDPHRNTYKVIYGKVQLALRSLSSLAIVVGGFLAVLFNREIVFGVQALLMLWMAFSFKRQLVDYTEEKPEVQSVREFVGALDDGVRLIFRDRTLFFFILTYISVSVANIIWASVILDPFLYLYTGTDQTMSTLKSGLFMAGSVVSIVAVLQSKRFNVKHLPWVITAYSVAFYGVYSFVIFTIEPGSANTIAIIWMFVGGTVGTFLHIMWLMLFQRYMIDIIPDNSRNAFYSLIPTLALLASSLALRFVTSYLTEVDTYGFAMLFFLLIPTFAASIFLFLSLLGYEQQEHSLDGVDANVLMNTSSLTGVTTTQSMANIMPSNWYFSDFARRSFNDLFDVANGDGVISSDESNMLNRIANDFSKYGEILEEAIADGVLTEEEKEKLLEMREDILTDSVRQANLDGHMTEEEEALYKKLQVIIANLAMLESDFE
jgi:MFS family permease